MRKMTTAEFIEQAQSTHGDLYDYSHVRYTTSRSKVSIICKNHGTFSQSANSHLMGSGCSKCRDLAHGSRVRATRAGFISRAKKLHGPRFDYSSVVYVNNKTKVSIICKEHGAFFQVPSSHLSGHGCPVCSGRRRHTSEEFATRARAIHREKYDYSKVDYKNTDTPVEIVCPTHGGFFQRPHGHLTGQGCPKCGIARVTLKQTFTLAQFVELATAKHKGRYKYDRVVYEGGKKPVEIICTEHGMFPQAPMGHLRGQGCPVCSGTKALDTPAFINRARKVHGDKYDYSRVSYVSTKKYVEILCRTHGVFLQRAGEHLKGKGCLECSGLKKLTTEEFIKKARKVHGDRYNYSRVDYVNNRTKVTIKCPSHGWFDQIATTHMGGGGCKECASEANGKRCRSTKEGFLTSARRVHGDTYDYSLVNYVTNTDTVRIICSEHGVFLQSPGSHLGGSGCRECGYLRNIERATKSLALFIDQGNERHGGKYEYSKFDYTGTENQGVITCPEHGDFMQAPHPHLIGHGCPACGLASRTKKRTMTNAEFITKATDIHGGTYDYALVTYSNTRDSVKIICHEHGVFRQSPGGHLSGQGCPKCHHPSDNDVLYIHEADGVRYNGEKVYKIGVTSQRMDRDARRTRLEYALGSPLTPVLYLPVAHGALWLEKDVLISVGEDPKFTPFDGSTEYRAISADDLAELLEELEVWRSVA